MIEHILSLFVIVFEYYVGTVSKVSYHLGAGLINLVRVTGENEYERCESTCTRCSRQVFQSPISLQTLSCFSISWNAYERPQYPAAKYTSVLNFTVRNW
jgi:hypothetical protein